MTQYPSGDAVLGDMRLRLDAMGETAAALIVEGPDDNKLFSGLRSPTTCVIIPAGGRVLLLEAFQRALPEDGDRVVFVTDCDYEVRAGKLRGAPGLIITEAADVESDLLRQPVVLDRVLLELLPDRLLSVAGALREKVLERAMQFALPLGRARCAAQPFGVSLDDLKVNHVRHVAKDGSVDVSKITETVAQRLRHAGVVSKEEWESALGQVPSDDRLIKGKDLLRAVEFVVRAEYGGRKVEADAVASFLRRSATPDAIEGWRVVERVRAWERRTGRVVLA